MSDFKADRICRTSTFKVCAPLEKVFPLLCPVREYDWIEPWACELIYSESGFAEDQCIFRTQFRDEGEAIYTVSRYEPDAGIIHFVITHPATHVEKLEITVEPLDDSSCRTTWVRTSTGLNPQGNSAIKEGDGEAYDAWMHGLDMMLNHFCRTGEMLPVAEAAD